MEQPREIAASAEAWAAEVTASVAQEIKRYRMRAGMSAQRLSDVCSEIGYPIPRAVIAKLESGHRKFITLPELHVIAYALRVPPLLLVVPVGYADWVAVAPRDEVPAEDALNWLRASFPPDDHTADPAAPQAPFSVDPEVLTPLRLLDVHQGAAATWLYYWDQFLRVDDPGTVPRDWAQAAMKEARGRLSATRSEMRERGYVLPDLPRPLRDIDSEVPRPEEES